MVIICPECETKYNINYALLPKEGKRVKCAKCKHTWLQKPLSADDVIKKLDNIDKKTKKSRELEVNEAVEPPEALPTKERKIANKSLPLFVYPVFGVAASLAALFFFLSAPHSIPGLGKFHDVIGMTNYRGLGFIDFSVKKEMHGKRIQFDMKGDIVNSSDRIRYIPKIRIIALSKGGHIMGEIYYKPPKVILMPKESVEVSPQITGVSGNAEKLIIDMGNKWELAFRSKSEEE